MIRFDTDTPPEVMLRGVHMDRLMPSLGRRERSTLARMMLAKKIGTAEMVAANRWFRDWAMATHGAFEGGGNTTSGEACRMFPAEIVVAARTSHRCAAEAIGWDRASLLIEVVCEGKTIRSLGQGSRDQSALSRHVAEGLLCLARHYTATDAKRKKIRLTISVF